jgi:hypothetical protein
VKLCLIQTKYIYQHSNAPDVVIFGFHAQINFQKSAQNVRIQIGINLKIKRTIVVHGKIPSKGN